jgi:hypothetical protein
MHAPEETLIDALLKIQTEWGLGPERMAALTHVAPQIFEKWMLGNRREQGRDSERVTIPSGMETAVPLIAIYRKVARRFPAAEDQVKWMTSPNADFDGHSPYQVATSSLQNLFWLSYYLDSSPDFGR